MTDMSMPVTEEERSYHTTKRLQQENAHLRELLSSYQEELVSANMTSKAVTDEVVEARRGVYGANVTDSFSSTAMIWSGILGVEIQPWQVPLCMIGLKLQRTGITPDYSDNSDDIDGYLKIFREILGDDMVHARTTDEYLAKKEQRKC